MHRPDVPDIDRDAVRSCPDDDVFDVVNGLNVSLSPDEIFGIRHLDDFPTDVVVGSHDGVLDAGDRYPVPFQLVRIYVNLVLAHVTADGSHFGHSLNTLEVKLHIPILHSAKRSQIILPFQRVPEDVAHAGPVGAELHLCACRQCGLYCRQFFENTTPGPVEIGRLIENDIDERHPEHRLGPDCRHLRHTLESGHKRKCDLVFHELGRSSHPLGEDDDLVFRQIGNRIKRRVGYGPDAPSHHNQVEQNHNELVAGGKIDYFFNHFPGLLRPRPVAEADSPNQA